HPLQLPFKLGGGEEDKTAQLGDVFAKLTFNRKNGEAFKDTDRASFTGILQNHYEHLEGLVRLYQKKPNAEFNLTLEPAEVLSKEDVVKLQKMAEAYNRRIKQLKDTLGFTVVDAAALFAQDDEKDPVLVQVGYKTIKLDKKFDGGLF